MCEEDRLELSEVITNCFDESTKILISKDETDTRVCMLVKLGCLSENDRV